MEVIEWKSVRYGRIWAEKRAGLLIIIKLVWKNNQDELSWAGLVYHSKKKDIAIAKKNKNNIDRSPRCLSVGLSVYICMYCLHQIGETTKTILLIFKP